MKRHRRSHKIGRRTFGSLGRDFALEPLEERRVLSVTLASISGSDAGGAFAVPSGKDLYVPLTGTDANQTISYAASSSNSGMHVAVLTGNPSLDINVSGTTDGGTHYTGTMTLQLFQNLAPKTVAVIENLVNSGFYTNQSFYRIVSGFVIQGGAGNSTTASTFKDEYNAALSFNSPGILAMANTAANSNSSSSEIFITAIGQPLTSIHQYLNDSYNAFGQLTSGFDIYNDVMSSTKSAPTITSASIVASDTQNGVVQISEPSNFSGSSTITITASATDGTSTQRSFNVVAAPPTQTTNNNPLILGPVSNQATAQNTPVKLQLSAIGFSGESVTFNVTDNTNFSSPLTAPTNVSFVPVSVSMGSSGTAGGTMTLTPATGFSGTLNLLVHVDDSGHGIHDVLPFTLTVAGPVVSISSVTSPINLNSAANTTISGTGDAGDTVSVVASNGASATGPLTTTVGAGGTWSISGINVSGLPDGTITYTAIITDNSNATAQTTKTPAKDTVAPAVALLATTNPINNTQVTNTTASGSGEPGATISVIASDNTHTSVAQSTTVAVGGTWSVSGINVSALADGTITYTATATDPAGNTATSSLTAAKNTVAPAVALTSVTSPISIGTAANTAASGTGEVGATISVVASDGTNTTAAKSTTILAGGAWTISGIDVSGLNDGTITYTATATDASGNKAQGSLNSTKTTAAIASVTTPINLQNAANTTATGTGQAGATISLVATNGAQSTVAKTTTVAQNGTWSISGIDTSALADGTITYTATASDGLQNSVHVSKTTTKDTAAPAVAITSVTAPINNANASNTTASGTGEVGASISVVASEGTHTSAAQTTTVITGGTWTVSGINVSGLNDGTITYRVTATDVSGNQGTGTATATKDTLAPAVAVTAVTNPINLTNSSASTASGTGEVGATISLVASDGTHTTTAKSAAVAAGGTWSLTGLNLSTLNDGPITYTATATDAAGNTAQSSMTATKATVVITSVTNPITKSSSPSTAASGTGEPGATISLVASDGTHTTTAKTATVTSAGLWSISPIDVSALNDGTITYTATASDSSSSTAHSSLTATKQTVANASLSGMVYVDANGNGSLGSGNSGLAGVMLTLNGTDAQSKSFATRTTTTGSDGSFTFTGLAAGTYSLAAAQPTTLRVGKGSAGNLGGSAGASVISNIVVTDGATGSNYNFSELGLAPQLLTINLFLATTPPAQVYLNSVVAAATTSLPIVTAIAKADADPTSASSVHYTVTFNQNVTGVVASDFKLVASSGLTGAAISGVSGSGNSYTVTVSTGSGSGTLGLNLAESGTIVGTLGGIGAGNFVGPSYTVTGSPSNKNAAVAVAVTSVTNPINLANELVTTASGTGSAGATVSLVASDGTTTTAAQTTVVTAGGTWSVTAIDTSGLHDGTITYTATATDSLGNTTVGTMTTVKDTVAPAVSLTTVTTPIDLGQQHATAASGTGTAGATISLVAGDGTHTTTAQTTTVSSGGTWSITGLDVSALADGTLTYTATASDTSGNTTQSSLTSKKQTVTLLSATNPITVGNQATTSANGTGQVGANISLVAGDGTSTTSADTTTVASDGTWSITGIDVSALNDGTITYTAIATDVALNSAQASFAAVKATGAVAVALQSVTNPIAIANQQSTTASGTATPGAAVTVTASDGIHSTSVGAATAAADGTWSIGNINVFALSDGTITYTATATDANNNSVQATLTATKKTVAITTVTNPINSGNAQATTASGTGQAGAAISLLAGDGTHKTNPSTTTIGAGGTWSISGIDTSGLNDGTITYTATATDSGSHTAIASLTSTKSTTASLVAVPTTAQLVDQAFADGNLLS